MKRRMVWCCLLALGVIPLPATQAATIFESGTLGTTGLARGDVIAASVSATVFDGVRFELTQQVQTSQIGGHFVGSPGTSNTFFGAIVSLEDGDDFPDSGDLSTSDVLGHTGLVFPETSAEIFGDLQLILDPGWYALVFGSGLFGTVGDGAMPLNNPDIGSPEYVGFQPGVGWLNLPDLMDAFDFVDYRMIVRGTVVPEPQTGYLFLIVTSRLATFLPRLYDRG